MGEKGEKPDLDGSELRIAIVVARYNEDVTRRLLRGAQDALQQHGVEEPDVYWVPGSLELPVTALALAEKGGHDAIVCLGSVIRGETFHFEVVAMQAASGLMQAMLDTGVPITFESFASSWFDRTGSLIVICRHDSGSGTSRFRSGPIVDSIAVTSSSRI